ncbi:MAG TPA: hypothetical protein VN436_12620, partial [Holophaga sp.]|nr:hypothetical protein [Holophaga sp.]
MEPETSAAVIEEIPGLAKTSPDAARLVSGRRAVAAASIGNALEWYDFSVYAFFAVFIAQSAFRQ